MDTLNHFRETIKTLFEEYAQYKPSYGEVETELILDDERGHYELSYIGWDGYRRIHGSVLHVDIRDDKIWVQQDGTDEGIASRLLEAGIMPEQIVLAFQHPYKRKLTPFAVA